MKCVIKTCELSIKDDGLYCYKKHREVKYEYKEQGDLKVHNCMVLNCTTKSTRYFKDGDKLYLLCAKHSISGSFIKFEIKKYSPNRLCAYKDCVKCSIFGDDINITYCIDHKKDHHINTRNKHLLCLNKCGKQGIFGMEGLKGTYCKSCIPNDNNYYYDLRHKNAMCKTVGCNTRASLVENGEGKPIWCISHVPNDGKKYKDSSKNYCKQEGCELMALYTKDNKSKINLEYCARHRPEGYWNPYKRCDYIYENGERCKIEAAYGLEQNRPISCFTHKKDGYNNTNLKKCDKCDKIAYYGLREDNIKLTCRLHAESNYVNVAYKLCTCGTAQNPNYLPYCAKCYYKNNPDIQVSKIFGIKEKRVVDYMKESYEDLELFNNKRIVGGSSSRRPDILIKVNKHAYIMIEIDENQHDNYDKHDEDERLKIIANDIKGIRALYQIRFNPDKYIIRSNDSSNITVIPSPWDHIIKVSCEIINETEWELRMTKLSRIFKKLYSRIQDAVENYNGKLITKSVFLFYDKIV